jgi:hypothetical protein
MPILDPISNCFLTKSSLSPNFWRIIQAKTYTPFQTVVTKSMPHARHKTKNRIPIVIRHSIAGISLMWRLAVNNRWINHFFIARWRKIFLYITWKTMNYLFLRLNDTYSFFFIQFLSCLSPRNCFVKIGFISFCIIPICFVQFRFDLFRFASISFRFGKFRFVSVNFVFVSRFVSQFTGTRLCHASRRFFVWNTLINLNY